MAKRQRVEVMTRIATAGLAFASLLLSARSVGAWQVVAPPGNGTTDVVGGLAIDPSGDVLLGGSTGGTRTPSSAKFTVYKFHRATGRLLWQHVGGAGRAWQPRVTPGGHVIVPGTLDGRPSRMVTKKLDGVNGIPLWEHDDNAAGSVVDAAGDVLAMGVSGIFWTPIVRKLDGDGGNPLWTMPITISGWESTWELLSDPAGDLILTGYSTIPGVTSYFGVAKLSAVRAATQWAVGFGMDENLTPNAVLVDGAGDVLAVTTEPCPRGVLVRKLSGTEASEMWQQSILSPGPPCSSGSPLRHAQLALSGDGDVLVTARFSTPEEPKNRLVAKLSGQTGSVLWQRAFSGLDGASEFGPLATPDGDLIVLGSLPGASGDADFAVMKLSGAGGEPIWVRTFDGTRHFQDAAKTAVIDSRGDIIAAGSLVNNCVCQPDDIFLVKLRGDTGDDYIADCADEVSPAGEDCDVGDVALEHVRLRADTGRRRRNGLVTIRAVATAPHPLVFDDVDSTGLSVRVRGAGDVDETLTWAGTQCEVTPTDVGARIDCEARGADPRRLRLRPLGDRTWRLHLAARRARFLPPLRNDVVGVRVTSRWFDAVDRVGSGVDARADSTGAEVTCRLSGRAAQRLICRR
jgi:hypothetical protein